MFIAARSGAARDRFTNPKRALALSADARFLKRSGLLLCFWIIDKQTPIVIGLF